jgi:hypothetical protein
MVESGSAGEYPLAIQVSAPCRAHPRKSPGHAAGAEKPYRCHHVKAPAQGGKAGNESLAAIIQK